MKEKRKIKKRKKNKEKCKENGYRTKNLVEWGI